MNVLFHTFWFPHRALYDGIFIREHAESVQMAGNTVAVQAIRVLPGKGLFSVSYEETLTDGGVKVYYLVVESIMWKGIYVLLPLLIFLAKRHYFKIIQPQFKPDIVVSNVLNPAGITGHFLAKKLGLKHVIIEHWSRIDKFMQKNVFSFLGKKAYLQADAIVPVSELLKQVILKYGVSGQNIYVIPNVVDTSVFKYHEKEHKNELVFCVASTLAYPKNPFMLMEALERVAKKSHRPIVLNIIGTGPDLDALREAARKVSYKVNFSGRYVTKPELAAEMQNADYFLHNTLFETFGLIVAEALCTGTPVGGSNIPAIQGLLGTQGINGVLCNNTVEEWAAGIEQLMQGTYNLKEISAEYTARFSKPGVGKQISDLLKKLTA